MKSFKKALAVVLSVIMLTSVVAPVGAVDPSGAAINASGATVTIKDVTFDGNGHSPEATVVLNGVTLKAGEDYVVTPIKKWAANTYDVVITFKGKYTGSATGKFTIKPAANGQIYKNPKPAMLKPTISGKAVKKVAASKVSSKAQTMKIKCNMKSDTTKVSFKVVSGNKKFISVNKNGKVTLKKGAPKGTYKIQVTAAKTVNYNKATKFVYIKVK